MPLPRVSFGMIVLNGEPFLRYNLRALYPFAHEIIVVEGAAPAAHASATPDGHSLDGTLETLHRFKGEEDPENKLIIVTKDGFWSEKDEMSQAYAARATGDYLWQIDSDEFYMPEDMQAVLELLHDDPSITAVSFPMITFWGDIHTVADSWYLRRGAGIFHRLFKWGKGYHYKTHRPPTVLDEQGRDTRKLHWLNGAAMRARGVFLYHYSLLLPLQVVRKSDYYTNHFDAAYNKWAEQHYLRLNNPFRVHNVFTYPSWLERYEGKHPPQVLALWDDLQRGVWNMETRPMADAQALLNSRLYALGRACVKQLDYPARFIKRVREGIARRLPRKR